MKKYILSLIFVLFFAYSPQMHSQTNSALTNAAIYWTAGHFVNYVGHYWGKHMGEYLNIQGRDIAVPTRLNVKYCFNAVGRELFANYVKWLPEAALNDIPDEARTAATQQTVNSRAWDAGRNFYTAWEFLFMLNDGWKLWRSIYSSKSIDPVASLNTTDVSDNAKLEMLHDSLFLTALQDASNDAEVLILAGLHAILANRLAWVAMHLGTVTTHVLIKKTPSINVHFADAQKDVSIFKLDPLQKIVESTVCTCFTQFLKPYMLYHIANLLKILNKYDEKYAPLYKKAYEIGDKSLWAYYGYRSQKYAIAAYADTFSHNKQD